MFQSGAVLVFFSEASGKTLRVKDNGDVEGKGGEGAMGKPQSMHIRVC